MSNSDETDASAPLHVYISPHLDDAALSCGGTISRQRRERQRVLVVSVCAGAPDGGDLSPYAKSLHSRWAEREVSAGRMLETRRAEDMEAMARLDADWLHLDVPDAPYRRDPETGAWLYEGDDAIFGPVAPGDDAWAARIARQIATALGDAMSARDGAPTGIMTIYAPLGVGGHVDHQLVRRATELWADRRAGGEARLLYYEDFPYAADETALAAALAEIDPEPRPARGDTREREKPDASGDQARAWSPLAESDLAAKIAAVAEYKSQISTFWSDAAEMAVAVREFAHRRGAPGAPAEVFHCRPARWSRS